MTLRNYILNGPSTVVLADSRDPNVSWQHHLDRTGGARGGVDLVAAVGTPVLAPTDGVWRHIPNNGGAGNSGQFGHDASPGWRDVFSHLSRYVGGSGQHFRQDDVIAYTGNTGGVVQHLHRHLLDPSGVRRNPWDYFSTVDPEEAKRRVRIVATFLNAAGLGSTTTSNKDGIPGAVYWTLVQTWGRANGHYPVGYLIDGVPGSQTFAVEAIIWDAVSKEQVRRVATYLNTRNLGKVSSSGTVNGNEGDGIPGPVLYWLIQTAGKADGIYPGIIDGETGPLTEAAFDIYVERTSTPVPTYYRPTDAPTGSLFGIDVSRYQVDFDFAAYATTGEDFVIIKRGGSNAGTYIDAQYQSHLAGARAAGLKVGHYWFNGLDGVASVAESAQAFLKGLDILPGEIVALDIENDATMPAYTPAEVAEWIAVVEKELGVKSLLYMSASLSRNTSWAPVANYPLWVAAYPWGSTSPNAGKYVPDNIDPLGLWGDEWQIHQYTSTVFGVIPGTTAKSLDRNIAKADTFTRFGFVKRPVIVVPEPTPEPELPVEPETPGWFVRFITALIDAFTKFLAGSK